MSASDLCPPITDQFSDLRYTPNPELSKPEPGPKRVRRQIKGLEYLPSKRPDEVLTWEKTDKAIKKVDISFSEVNSVEVLSWGKTDKAIKSLNINDFDEFSINAKKVADLACDYKLSYLTENLYCCLSGLLDQYLHTSERSVETCSHSTLSHSNGEVHLNYYLISCLHRRAKNASNSPNVQGRERLMSFYANSRIRLFNLYFTETKKSPFSVSAYLLELSDVMNCAMELNDISRIDEIFSYLTFTYDQVEKRASDDIDEKELFDCLFIEMTRSTSLYTLQSTSSVMKEIASNTKELNKKVLPVFRLEKLEEQHKVLMKKFSSLKDLIMNTKRRVSSRIKNLEKKLYATKNQLDSSIFSELEREQIELDSMKYTEQLEAIKKLEPWTRFDY